MEQDLQNHKEQTESCKNFWTDEDVNALGRALTFCWKNSDQYGNDLELKVRASAFKAILEHDTKIEWVLGAIKIHMSQSTDMVKPAHVCKILRPQKYKITQTEFIHAKEQHALEGYKAHSYHAQIIRDFEIQERIERDVPSPQEIIDRRAIAAVHPDLKKRLEKEKKKIENNV